MRCSSTEIENHFNISFPRSHTSTAGFPARVSIQTACSSLETPAFWRTPPWQELQF